MVKPFAKSKFLLLIFLSVFIVNFIGNIPHLITGKFLSPVFAQSSPLNIIGKGRDVIINQKTVNLPWIQWQEKNEIHTGIADMSAEAILGIELMSTTNTEKQPIHWFNYQNTLPAKFINPYRYLDITDLTKTTPLQINNNSNILELNLPISQVNKIYEIQANQGKKIIIELDKPSFFQVSQGKEQAIITINGQPSNTLFDDIKPLKPLENSGIQEEEGDEIRNDNLSPTSTLFSVSSKDDKTLINLNLPAGNNVKVTSANPNLLLVDINPSAITTRDINWHNDLFFSKKYVSLNNNSDLFLVSSLTLNLKSFNLNLQPILANNNTVIGTAPLKTTAQNSEAIAAINAGFFNRNNQLPLGVIKNRDNWLSSPILNRCIMAWNDMGEVKFDRIMLEEIITTTKGDRFINNYINSGYIQAGVARYTSSWGLNYTTLSDNEIVFIVENNLVKDKIVGGKAGEDSIVIQPKNYLLVFRSAKSLAAKLDINDQITLNTGTIPANFATYPYIIGAGPLLLLNRQIVLNGETEKFSKAFNTQKASRSAIAVDNQGKILLVAIHNRVGGLGVTLSEFAAILLKIGAVSALNLDGGSSTQMYLGGAIVDRSPATAARVHNGIGVFYRQK
ncbi:phosphodiester glycosidase family protein [Geminocystis sp. GBBB08]|uniref:phosphodiester glycosidase family protein n=1 Tax=Geminocystis sp. GBBB08 TaxID=2604140 RepID=UPI0027E2B08F|nr:phosphodiester glycosidase family protein [Geminocystis sp. GBBB08]MBL1209098.1 phosphodiester glycosidase family protein [Geminocystis sp. GBBB08]